MDDLELDLDETPLTILVGRDMHSVFVRSLAVRRALRYVASANVEAPLKSSGRPPKTSLSAKALQRLLSQTLLRVVTFPMNGRRSTQDLKIHIDEPPLQLEGAPTFWDLMRQESANRGGSIALQQARIQWIDEAQRWITFKLLNSLVFQFECAIGLQASLLALSIVCEFPVAATKQYGVDATKPIKRTLVRTPLPWRETDPPLVMGSNGAWFGRDHMHPSELVNIQILGSTGSGKTVSCVEPVLGALLNYEIDSFQTAMLVIDPKRELEAKVRSVLSQRGELDRLVVIGECPPIRYFATDCPLSPTDRLAKCKAFGPLITPDGDITYWQEMGQTLLRDLLQLQSDFAVKTSGERLFGLMTEQLGTQSEPGTWGQLREILSWARRGGMSSLKQASEVLERLAAMAGVTGAGVNALKNYTKDDDLFRQFTYACQNADPLINALGNPDVKNFIDMDPLPGERQAHTDIRALVEAGKVVLFCPEAREGHRLAGKALKAKFFEAVFSRENLARPMAYVCDEAQRFITQDAETGEQNFLDRCRAYRAICVLASQSLASIEHELGSGHAARTAMDIISTNTPTKFVMRTTDTRTIDWLRTMLPAPDIQGPHVVDVRRPSQLRVGEAFSIFADGRWGLHRARLADLT